MKEIETKEIISYSSFTGKELLRHTPMIHQSSSNYKRKKKKAPNPYLVQGGAATCYNYIKLSQVIFTGLFLK